jgi:hypothetical protein
MYVSIPQTAQYTRKKIILEGEKTDSRIEEDLGKRGS